MNLGANPQNYDDQPKKGSLASNIDEKLLMAYSMGALGVDP